MSESALAKKADRGIHKNKQQEQKELLLRAPTEPEAETVEKRTNRKSRREALRKTKSFLSHDHKHILNGRQINGRGYRRDPLKFFHKEVFDCPHNQSRGKNAARACCQNFHSRLEIRCLAQKTNL